MKTFILLLFCSFNLAAAPLKLALNWKAEPQFGGFYAANYALYQLDVQVLEGGSGTPTLQMVSSGSADYGIVSADELIVAYDRGNTDLVALFASYQTNPQAIMVHAERNYKKLNDVLLDEKATLLWQEGLPYAQFIKKKFKNLKIKTAPYQGGLGVFQNKKDIAQQCFATAEPITARKLGLQVKTFLVSETGYNPYTTVLITQKSRLEKNPVEVKNMVRAVRAGWRSYLQAPAATHLKMFALNKAMDIETFKLSAEAQAPFIRGPAAGKELGLMTPERWRTLASQLQELGIVKSTVNAQSLFKNL